MTTTDPVSMPVSAFIGDAIVRVPPNADLYAVSDTLAEADIGAAVVGDDEVVGVISECEIVRALAARRDPVLTDAIDVVNTSLVWCDANAGLTVVAGEMMIGTRATSEEDCVFIGVVSARESWPARSPPSRTATPTSANPPENLSFFAEADRAKNTPKAQPRRECGLGHGLGRGRVAGRLRVTDTKSSATSTTSTTTSTTSGTIAPGVASTGTTRDITVATPDGRDRRPTSMSLLAFDAAIPCPSSSPCTAARGRAAVRGGTAVRRAGGGEPDSSSCTPTASGSATTRRCRTWNGGVCCGAAPPQDVDDVTFLRQLVEQSREYDIDADRVYATVTRTG